MRLGTRFVSFKFSPLFPYFSAFAHLPEMCPLGIVRGEVTRVRQVPPDFNSKNLL